MTKSTKTHIYWVCFALIWIIIDQLVKWVVVTHLTYNQPMHVTPFLNFYLIFNHGAAFGMLSQQQGWQTVVFSLLAVVIATGLLIAIFKTPAQNWLRQMSFALIVAGAVGNLIDRLNQGFVIDFIQLHLADWSFAIFNVADACITIGVLCLLITFYSRRS